jgi:hypothetical protein
MQTWGTPFTKLTRKDVTGGKWRIDCSPVKDQAHHVPSVSSARLGATSNHRLPFNFPPHTNPPCPLQHKPRNENKESASWSHAPSPTLEQTPSLNDFCLRIPMQSAAAEDVIMADTTPSQPQRTDHDWRPVFPTEAPVTQSQPHASQDLVTLYDLSSITASVRRTDPVTGEKINKLRKSYEGIVKQLHIAGVNKQAISPGEFINGGLLLDVPEEEWQERASENPVQHGLTPNLQALLDSAVHMAPGRLLDGDKYKKIIGTDDAPKAKLAADALKKGSTFPQAQSGHPSAAPSPTLKAQAAGQASRPARTGAKRRYHDTTFKGYGEGFADDDLTNLSEEEARDLGVRQKRRRKVNITLCKP